ncbi:hypothetical protein [Nocardiopsis protaetiae]|uniref:hypothetical protein n=1 Tax=Nocardiopsis protaetiae TaxID=3382270 RepID=UPI00387B6D9C
MVVATLRSAQKTQMLEGAGAGRLEGFFNQVTEFELDRVLSAAERERAGGKRGDERIAQALDREGVHGFASLLANGPQLLAEWKRGWSPNTDPNARSRPRGAALVTAAVEVRRCGARGPISRDLLERLHTRYLEERGGESLNPEPFAEAWKWSTAFRRGTTRLLSPSGDGRVEVFDFLVDEVERRTRVEEQVPEKVFEEVLATDL